MSIWHAVAYLAAILMLALSVRFGLMVGPFYYMIDDSNEPGPPQNRRNAILFSAGSLIFAVLCAWVAAS